MSRERVYVRKTSATKLLITIVIVIIAAGVLTKSFADSGLFYELLKALCKAIPFSGKCLEFCTKFAEKALGAFCGGRRPLMRRPAATRRC